MSNYKNIGLNYDPMSVEDLFGQDEYYTVPRYQRGYSWGIEEVKELLSDIAEAARSFPDEAYLLGQIIVCPSRERLTTIPDKVGQWDLIDGQQRCTTLYLLIVTATKRINEKLDPGDSLAERRRRATYEALRTIPDEADENLVHPRVKPAANGLESFVRLLHGQDLDKPDGPTQANIATAVAEIDAFFETMTVEQVQDFLSFVLAKVWLVRLSLESSAHALRVFQKVNDRGLALDDADLIKNFLFQKVSDSEFRTLSEKWETATNTLHQARLKRVKSMEFLMKALVGIRTSQSVPTGSLYTTWATLLDSEDKVQSLAASLPGNAKSLVRISKGQLPTSGIPTDLAYGTYMQSWIQQFEVLLAGTELTDEVYKRLLILVEDRAMLSYWAKEPSQKFEVIIHPWANQIKKLGPTASADDVVAASEKAREGFEDLAARAQLGINSLRYSVASHRDKMRYVLARVNRYLQSELSSTTMSISSLMQTSKGEDKGFDLDHVFPQNPNQRAYWIQDSEKDVKFGSEDRYVQSIQSIGNLILLHPEDNRGQSDSLPSDNEKQINLAQSELFSNRILANKNLWNVQSGKHFEKLESWQSRLSATLDEWGEQAIDLHADFYWWVLKTEMKNNLGIQ